MSSIRTVTLAATLVLLSGVAFAQATPEQGQKVFAAAKCIICHSVAGTGNAKGPLDGVGSKLSAADIRQWITAAPEMAAKTNAQRKPAMKAYTDMKKDDVDALVEYLQTLKK